MKLNRLHHRARQALSPYWRHLARLKKITGLDTVAFDDLVVAGIAEVQRVPIKRGDIQCGEQTFFRLIDKPRKNKQPK